MLSSRCCAAAALALASSVTVLVVACAAASSGAEPTTTPTAATTASPAGSAATANCTRCGGAVMQSRAVRLRAIKAQILSKLGMKRAPNVTRRALPGIQPLHQLLDRYDAGMMQADAPFEPGEQYDDDDDFHVAAEKIITFGQHAPPEMGLVPEWQAVHFRFSEAALNLHVSKAHLWVFVSSNQSSSSAAVWVTLYQVARDAASAHELHLVKVRTKEEKGNLQQGFWVQMDARKLVSHWFRHRKDNLGIVVHAYDSEGRKVHVTVEPPPGREALRPFLVAMVDKNGRSRTRRMVGLNCQDNSSEERCCRYPLTVDFEEFGWDWIIAPKRYEANYCSGECPYVFMQKYPHTHVVQQVNLSGSPGPCCAPRKISAISMLYFDDNHNIVYGVLPGMIVERCGCY
ncbi:growth/differentiation factor 8-like [Dermacentor andersoni]|uniref:growth/differentiation factor 8-like n=1 Tax=Dermacentor andersoni TaxID=34620 RepID=UPI0021556319|nr:growth/differentiation factor 11-like [Dermacentor andersoni]